MSKKFTVDFRCPNCADDVLIERNRNCVVDYSVKNLEAHKDDLESLNSNDLEVCVGLDESLDIDDNIDIMGGTEYVCSMCGKIIAESEEDLFYWLRKHEMLKEKD